MIDLIDIDGAPFARGAAYGAQAAGRIRAHVRDWLSAMALAGGCDGEAYARALVRDTDFKAAIAEHAPDLVQEVDGVAEGAGVDPELMYALQLVDEEWAYRKRGRRAARTPEKCSSFAFAGADGPGWIGQNMDLSPHTAGHQMALRVRGQGDAPSTLVFTVAGLLALMGVNSAGLGVCVNSLPQLPSRATGLPVAFMIRRLLQARTLDAAVALVRTLPHATNQHYVLAAPGAVRSFECSAAGVVEYHPPQPDRVLHTNHPLGGEPGDPEAEAERRNSVARLRSLETRLGAGRPDLQTLQAALCACDDPQNPVCRVYDPEAGLIGYTTGAMISAIAPGPEPLRAWMSAGPPSVAGYDALTLPRPA